VRIRVEVDLLEVHVSELYKELLAGAGLGDRAFEDLADRGALRAAVTGIATAITSAAIRPCRLAGPASGMSVHWPVTKSLTSTASPTAKISGSLVRICSSARIPPRWPISIPAIFASAVSGRTPIARITTSAGCILPEFVRTSSEPSADCRNPATPSLSSSRTLCFTM